jgi:hypothetical protein
VTNFTAVWRFRCGEAIDRVGAASADLPRERK